MTAKEAVIWLINIMADIGKAEHRDLWHYEQALMEIREMLEDESPQWIPCSERLPEEDTDVLVTRHFLSDKELKKNAITESFYVEVASRIDEWTSYSDEYKIKRHLHKVIAWMPLPEPWKGEQE